MCTQKLNFHTHKWIKIRLLFIIHSRPRTIKNNFGTVFFLFQTNRRFSTSTTKLLTTFTKPQRSRAEFKRTQGRSFSGLWSETALLLLLAQASTVITTSARLRRTTTSTSAYSGSAISKRTITENTRAGLQTLLEVSKQVRVG